MEGAVIAGKKTPVRNPDFSVTGFKSRFNEYMGFWIREVTVKNVSGESKTQVKYIETYCLNEKNESLKRLVFLNDPLLYTVLPGHEIVLTSSGSPFAEGTAEVVLTKYCFKYPRRVRVD